jgi:hypothetical protein
MVVRGGFGCGEVRHGVYCKVSQLGVATAAGSGDLQAVRSSEASAPGKAKGTLCPGGPPSSSLAAHSGGDGHQVFLAESPEILLGNHLLDRLKLVARLLLAQLFFHPTSRESLTCHVFMSNDP